MKIQIKSEKMYLSLVNTVIVFTYHSTISGQQRTTTLESAADKTGSTERPSMNIRTTARETTIGNEVARDSSQRTTRTSSARGLN